MNDWLNPDPDENQLSLLPEPVEHLDPEPPPPPGPIRTLQQQVEDAGWIPKESVACLYVSAGADTRPFIYLRPEVIPEEMVADWVLPRFFVFVDRDRPAGAGEMPLEFDDGRTTVETIDERTVDPVAWDMAALLRIRITSDRFPEREYAVLRIRGDNERFCQDALAEGWSPHWYIGVRDGCVIWGERNPCTNVIDSPEESIPLRLGVQFWLTEHFAGHWLGDERRRHRHAAGHSIPTADGRHLKELMSWRRWPAVREGTDWWVSLFRLGRP